MLQDSFIEVHFVKENKNKGLFTVIWLICLIVIILLINMLPFLFGFPYLLLLTVSLSFALAYGFSYLKKRLKKEYQIEITNEYFEISRIVGDSNCQELLNFSIKDCEFIGPVTDDRYKDYISKVDFNLNITPDDVLVTKEENWAVYLVQEGRKFLVAFPFKEEMYPVFRRYNPRYTVPYIAKKTVEKDG